MITTSSDNYIFINDIVFFVNHNEFPKSLVKLEKILSKDDLRIVSIKLLGWLKYQHASSLKRALKMKDDYKWCTDFKKWLSNDTKFLPFAYLLDVTGRLSCLVSNLKISFQKAFLYFCF